MIKYNDLSLEYLILIVGILIISILIITFIPRYSKLFWNLDSNTKLISQRRINTIDTLRGIAIIGIVITHSHFLLFSTESAESDSYIISSILITELFRSVIPVFLFTSGLLLKPFVWNRKSIFEFYKSKLIRIFIPYFLITFVLWRIGYTENKSLLNLLVTGSAAIPLYFVPFILQIYLIYPILDFIRLKNPYSLVKISFLISFISTLLPFTLIFSGITLFFPHLIFFVYGMVRKNILYEKISPIWKELIYIYFIIQIFIIYRILQLGIDGITLRIIIPPLYSSQFYFDFAVILTLYKYFSRKSWISRKINNIIAPIGRISLWIFLIHFPIQKLIFNLFKFYNQKIIIGVIINTILTLVLSISISFLLNKVYSYLIRTFNKLFIRENKNK